MKDPCGAQPAEGLWVGELQPEGKELGNIAVSRVGVTHRPVGTL